MDLLRIPEIFVTYLDFLLDFAVGPQAALGTYAGASRLADTLFLFLLAGATTAYFIIFAAHKIGLKPDRELVRDNYGPLAAALLASDLDSKVVPLVSVFLIFPAAIVFHLSATVGTLLLNLLFDSSWGLGGTIRDTINAAFAFGSFFLPIWAVTIVFISWRARGEKTAADAKIDDLAAIIVVVALIFAYFPLALAGTHPGTTFTPAFFAFIYGLGGWVVGLLLILLTLASMLRVLLGAGGFVWTRLRRP